MSTDLDTTVNRAIESLDFTRTVKQKEATKLLVLKKHAMLYGGSRSGKTFIAIRSLIIRALKYPGSRHLIIRYRFNHVKQSIWFDTFPKVMKLCFPGVLFKENKSDWFVQFQNGSELWFGGTDDKERVEKILGNEYATIYANECSQIPYEAITLIRTRLAQRVRGLKNKFWYDCNPPSKKHWTYLYFIERRDPKTREKIKNATGIGYLHMNPEDNLENLPDDYIEELENLPRKQRERFLKGLFGSDVDGALWNWQMVDDAHQVYADLEEKKIRSIRTVVALDPAISSEEDSDLWGITVGSKFSDGRGAVEKDASLIDSPRNACKIAIRLFNALEADAIVAEKNQGGDMITDLLRLLKFKGRVILVHASKGKYSRAEPVSALYEQKLIGHARGLEELEEEMMEYVPHLAKKSPDRMDSGVWLLTELFKEEMKNVDTSDVDIDKANVSLNKTNDFDWSD